MPVIFEEYIKKNSSNSPRKSENEKEEEEFKSPKQAVKVKSPKSKSRVHNKVIYSLLNK